MQIDPVRVVVDQLHAVGQMQQRVARVARLRQARQRIWHCALHLHVGLVRQPVQLGQPFEDAMEQHIEARLAQSFALAVGVAMGERGGCEEGELERMAGGCGLLGDVIVGDGQVGHAHELIAGEEHILRLPREGVVAPHAGERETPAPAVISAPTHAVNAGAPQRHDEVGEGFERVCEQGEAKVNAATGRDDVVTPAQIAPRLDGERARAVLAARVAFVERGKQVAHHRVSRRELQLAAAVARRVLGEVDEGAEEHAAQGAAGVLVQGDGVAGGQFDVQPVGDEWVRQSLVH